MAGIATDGQPGGDYGIESIQLNLPPAFRRLPRFCSQFGQSLLQIFPSRADTDVHGRCNLPDRVSLKPHSPSLRTACLPLIVAERIQMHELAGLVGFIHVC